MPPLMRTGCCPSCQILWSGVPSRKNEGVWATACQQLAVQVGLLLVFVGGSMECRQRYFTWLQETVIEPLQDKNPEIWDAAMEFFKNYTIRLTEVEDEEEQGAAPGTV